MVNSGPGPLGARGNWGNAQFGQRTGHSLCGCLDAGELGATGDPCGCSLSGSQGKHFASRPVSLSIPVFQELVKYLNKRWSTLIEVHEGKNIYI